MTNAPTDAVKATDAVAPWQFHSTFFRRSYRLINGSTVKTFEIMRRANPDGVWQYRSPTKEERGDDFYMLQW